LKNKHQKGETVYIARNPADSERNLYKIGRTKDLDNRTGQYATAVPDGVEIIHRIATCDSHLVEKVVHHILDVHRYDANREWFQGDPELFRRVVNAVAHFVDGLTDSLHNVNGLKFDEIMKRCVNKLKNFDDGDGASDSSTATQSSIVVNSSGSNAVVNVTVNVAPELVLARDFCSERVIPDAGGTMLQWKEVCPVLKEWGTVKGRAVPSKITMTPHFNTHFNENAQTQHCRRAGKPVYGWRNRCLVPTPPQDSQATTDTET